MIALVGRSSAAAPILFDDESASSPLTASFDIGAAWVEYPKNEFFANRGEAPPFARGGNLDTDDGDDIGYYLSGEFSYDFGLSLLGSDASRFSLRGSYFALDSNTTASFTDPGAGTRFGWVGLDGAGFGTGTGITLSTASEREIVYGEIDLTMSLDYGEGSKLPFTVFFGPSYRDLSLDSSISGAFDSVTATSVLLLEDLETEYYGGTIGVATSFPLNTRLSASVQSSVSLFNAETNYSADYSDSSPSSAQRSLSDSELAFGADIRVGLDYALMDNVTLGGYVGVKYLSYAPQVAYGSVATDPAAGVLRLEEDDLFSVIGGLSVTCRF